MATPISGIDDAGRKIAGLLTYNPGPGIYSRLERAIQQMPESVRTQELPGLLKRYKEGVPGWELTATDLDSVIAGRDVVPRDDLLARVREASPVYTHKEVVLGGTPQKESQWFLAGSDLRAAPWMTDAEHVANGDVNRTRAIYGPPGGAEIGHAQSAGAPIYEAYGQGGRDYTEILVTQPGLPNDYDSPHWNFPAVAHARFDVHGDALRINELQSDLGSHNRKAREFDRAVADADRAGNEGELMRLAHADQPAEIPFPLEDTWADLLIKRLALEAARKGHRAIEVASPRAIADKVGGNIDNYEHFYGKVVPGALERLGRKMGGLVEDLPGRREAVAKDVWSESEDLLNQYRRFNQGEPDRIDAFNDLLDAASPATQRDAAQRIYEIFDDGDPGYATAVTRDAMALAEQTNAARAVRERLLRQGIGPPKPPSEKAGRRYLMSDEMRRRIIEQGIGASVLAPLLMQEE